MAARPLRLKDVTADMNELTRCSSIMLKRKEHQKILTVSMGAWHCFTHGELESLQRPLVSTHITSCILRMYFYTNMRDTNDAGRDMDASAHLLSRALVSQSPSVTCCTLAGVVVWFVLLVNIAFVMFTERDLTVSKLRVRLALLLWYGICMLIYVERIMS
jgi:hypothetical protein